MDTIVTELIKLLFAVATAVAVPLALKFVYLWLQKMGLSLDAEKRAKVEKLAQDAILAAEEWALAKLKIGDKVISADKLDAAVAHLMGHVPGITIAEATALVNQELPKMRASAQGFLAAARAAAETP